MRRHCGHAQEFFHMETIGTWWMWVGFAVFVLVAIAVDLLVMEKQGAHKVTTKEALSWSVIWFSLAFVFVALLWWYLNSTQGRDTANEVSMQFITGYLVEKSLSVPETCVDYWHHWCNRFARRADFGGRMATRAVSLGALCVWCVFGIDGNQDVARGGQRA
jgi:small-conductance mechanosensitive channel